MRSTLASLLVLSTFVRLAPPSPAVEILVPINTNASTVRVELCLAPAPLSEQCDNDTRPVSGFLLVDLDRASTPPQVALRDFDANAMGPLTLSLVWFLIGRVDITNQNLRIYHAAPGPANPHVPLTNDQCSFTNVPYQTAGTANYRVSGGLCPIVEGMGIPCVSNLDLSTLGANTAESVPGTFVVSNGVLHAYLDLSFSTPLDPNTPELGALTGRAIIRGTAPINEPPSVALLSPAPGSVFAAGRPVMIQAQAQDSDGSIALVEFFAGTNKIGQKATPPFDFLWANPTSAWHTLTARATDNQGAATVSDPVLINVGVFSMLPAGSVWKYHDQGTDLGAAWRARIYDDSAWASGPAKLGYGEEDIVTEVSFGANPDQKHITTYFRHSWILPDRSLITGLTLRLLRDDGAVVFLNGISVLRDNFTNSPVYYTNLAATTISGADETNWLVVNLNTAVGLLLTGTNTLAVEVHQSSPSSSDLSFDLELQAATRFVNEPRLWIQRQDSQTCLIRWPDWAVGYQLQSATSLTAPIQWTPVTAPVQRVGSWLTVQTDAGTGARYFRLKAD
jgi:hypothetical protein